jgi:hypothetical protein
MSLVQGLSMVDVSVALRGGIKLVTAQSRERAQKRVLWWILETLNGLHTGLGPKQGTRARGRARKGGINVVTGSEPILPHSVEVQNNWTDAELYPHSSFTFKSAQPYSSSTRYQTQ